MAIRRAGSRALSAGDRGALTKYKSATAGRAAGRRLEAERAVRSKSRSATKR